MLTTGKINFVGKVKLEISEVTAADLVDPKIHIQAPFYAMDTADGLLGQLRPKIDQRAKRRMRLPYSGGVDVIDAESGAQWDPISFPEPAEHWHHGVVSIDADHVSDYYYTYNYLEGSEDIAPDLFICGDLIVSGKARGIIEEVAPGYCYFPKAKFTGHKTERLLSDELYYVFIRYRLSYFGPAKLPALRPQGEVNPVVDSDTWTNFCENKVVQNVASNLPIFLFDDFSQTPIFRADLLKRLKDAGMSGLLESSRYNVVLPKRAPVLLGFETVYPLDPFYRSVR